MIEDNKTLNIKPDTIIMENQYSDLRKKAFKRYQENKKSKLIFNLSTQLSNIPQLFEEFTKKQEMILDISKELSEKLANGELEFIRKSVTGEVIGILKDPKTGRIFTQLPIKEMPLELGASIATVGLSAKMQDISNKLEVLDDKINRVNRNFDLNRYAEVQSAKEKFNLAILTKNPEAKKNLLLASLSQSTDAKNLLLNQLYEIKMQLKISQHSGNWLSDTITMNKKADDEARLAQIALDNLDYMKDAFSFQIANLAELREYDALNYIISDFKDLIMEDFSGDEALFLDGHLPPTSANPFMYLSENILESSISIIKFLDDNEDLLNLQFSLTNMVSAKEEKESESKDL